MPNPNVVISSDHGSIIININDFIGRNIAQHGYWAKADIALPGDIAPVILAGTVYAGDILAIDSNSKFAASTPSDGDIIGAIALEAGVAGDLVDALIVKATRHEAG